MMTFYFANIAKSPCMNAIKDIAKREQGDNSRLFNVVIIQVHVNINYVSYLDDV